MCLSVRPFFCNYSNVDVTPLLNGFDCSFEGHATGCHPEATSYISHAGH
jgi:hypothetical protein